MSGTLGTIRVVSKRYSTSTLIDAVSCAPWLAAEGPLAYSPENPPATDYFFQYSWILPELRAAFGDRLRIAQRLVAVDPMLGRDAVLALSVPDLE